MFVYSRFSLLAIRNLTKPLTCHGSVRRPSLPSHVWNMLKSFDLLAPRRGQRGRDHHRSNRINTIISSSSDFSNSSPSQLPSPRPLINVPIAYELT